MAVERDWNTKIIEEFRANHGKVGGPFEGAPLLLLHTKGARSGLERTNPMMYLSEDDRVLVFASKGGSDSHPDWYYNLLANPDVAVERGTQTYEATASVVEGDERDRIYAEQASRYKGFADYAEKTDRVITVIALTPK